ncbi:MAG: PAS-domain containing protein [Rhodocyclaceae bacterium]|nr:PAS-domain containing protein [Rhodocyclaceae bacterium]
MSDALPCATPRVPAPPAPAVHDILQTIIDFLPSGVTLFDHEFNMIVCNRQLRELLDFPDSLFEDGLPNLRTLARFNAERGDYGPGDPDVLAAAVIERAMRREAHVFERARPNGRILEIRGNPLPDGGFVTIYTDITERKRAEEEARRSASYLDAVVSALPQGISVVDEDLQIALWNPAFVKLQNLPDGFMKPGITFAEVVRFNAQRGEYGPVDPEARVRSMVELARRFEPHRLERTRGDGGSMEVEGRVVLEDGRPVGFVTTYTDITERVRSEQTIRRVKNLMSDAINFSPTYIWETDREGRYTFAQGLEKILGQPDASIVGLDRWATLFGPDGAQVPAHARILQQLQTHDALDRQTIRTTHLDGREMWLSCSAQPVHDDQGAFVGYRGVDVDVTDLTRAHQELEQMALHDPLTGLGNRRKLLSRFELEVARMARSGGSLALLIIDIDHFKAINDTHGHLVGDECLRGLANLLSSNLRAVDLVARFGGEEFVVLLSDTRLDQARIAAEKLCSTIAASRITVPDAEPLRITISIGVAGMCAGDSRSFDQLLEEADLGVYAAKHAGRNRVCTARDIESHMSDRSAEGMVQDDR